MLKNILAIIGLLGGAAFVYQVGILCERENKVGTVLPFMLKWADVAEEAYDKMVIEDI